MTIPGRPSFLSGNKPVNWQEQYAKDLEFHIEEAEEEAVEKLNRAFTSAQEAHTSSPQDYALGEKKYSKNKVTLKTGKSVLLLHEKCELLKETHIVSCIGTRDAQEDAHIATKFEVTLGGIKTAIELRGVFDGHNGTAECSQYVANNIVEKLKEKLEQFNANQLTNKGIRNALKHAFVQLNYDYHGKGGTCAIVSLKINDILWTANLGDSRAILCDVETGKTIALSRDQKAVDPKYRKGIEKRMKRLGIAVCIEQGYLVYGPHQLAVAKCFGNRHLPPFMSARPTVTKVILEPGKKYIHAVYCDGVSDVMPNGHVGQFLLQRQHQYKESLKRITRNLVAAALATFSSDDNITAIVSAI